MRRTQDHLIRTQEKLIRLIQAWNIIKQYCIQQPY